MKLNTIKCLLDTDIRHLLAELVAKKSRPTANGGKTGGQAEAAREIGMGQPHFNAALNGDVTPPAKVLDFFGLEAKKVYVKKEGK